MCLFPDHITEMGHNFSVCLRGGAMLMSLTSVLRGFNRHPREIRSTAYVTHFSFYSALTPFHIMERTVQCGIISSSSSSSFFLPSYLISPSSQEAIWNKRCLVKGYDGAVCFHMLLCLMSCQDIRTGMGWDRRRSGEGGAGGKREGTQPWFGRGIWGREKAELSGILPSKSALRYTN